MRKTLLSLLLAALFLLNACTPAAPVETAPPTQAASSPTILPSLPTETAASRRTHRSCANRVYEPIALTFMAGYKPQANLPFVGAYVAKEKGFFERNGLDVTIEHSPGRGEHVVAANGRHRAGDHDGRRNHPPRAAPNPACRWFRLRSSARRGSRRLPRWKDSGLTSPKDWEGKTVGYKGTPPPDLYALLAAAGADVNRVNLVNVGFDPRVLSEKQVDVYPLFKSNEPYLLRKWGYELTLWDAADYGVPTLGLAYVTSEAYLAEHRDAIVRFLRAALQGIAYAQAHPDEAVEIVMKYAGPETDPAHMRYMLETELRDAQSENGFGWQSAGQWQALAEMLTKYNALPAGLDVNAAFDTSACGRKPHKIGRDCSRPGRPSQLHAQVAAVFLVEREFLALFLHHRRRALRAKSEASSFSRRAICASASASSFCRRAPQRPGPPFRPGAGRFRWGQATSVTSRLFVQRGVNGDAGFIQPGQSGQVTLQAGIQPFALFAFHHHRAQFQAGFDVLLRAQVADGAHGFWNRANSRRFSSSQPSSAIGSGRGQSSAPRSSGHPAAAGVQNAPGRLLRCP